MELKGKEKMCYKYYLILQLLLHTTVGNRRIRIIIQLWSLTQKN